MMAKRPNISPSGWLSNLAGQPRTQKSPSNAQNEFIRANRHLFRKYSTTPPSKDQLAQIETFGLTHLIGTL